MKRGRDVIGLGQARSVDDRSPHAAALEQASVGKPVEHGLNGGVCATALFRQGLADLLDRGFISERPENSHDLVLEITPDGLADRHGLQARRSRLLLFRRYSLRHVGTRA